LSYAKVQRFPRANPPCSVLVPLRLCAFAFLPAGGPRARLLLLLVPLLAAFGLPAFADDAGVARLEALGEAMRRHEAWTAEYRQEYVAPGMSAGEEQSGEVWAAWPLRALFVARDPEARALGLDGRRVRLVDFEVGSCDDHQLTDEEWQRVPLAALLDPRGTSAQFSVEVAPGGEIVLEPRSPGGVMRVEVSLDATHLPVLFVVVDAQGAVNRVRFSGWSPSPSPASWVPEPPPGVVCTDTEGE